MADVADLFVQGSGGGAFVSSEERKELEKTGKTFSIKAVRFEPTGKYGASHVLTIDLDGEERDLRAPYGSGMDSRDQTVENILGYLDAGGDPVQGVKVETAGNGWVLAIA